MHRLLRTVAAVLLIPMAMALPGGRVMSSPAALARHPAGCHSPGPATRFPGPTSYQCCASGHQAALPNASFALGSALRSSLRCGLVQLCSLDGSGGPRLSFVTCLHSAVFVVPFSSPPGVAPLRV
jgi:hypothetical protein